MMFNSKFRAYGQPGLPAGFVLMEISGKALPPTPVFLPGESHGQRILAGYSL